MRGRLILAGKIVGLLVGIGLAYLVDRMGLPHIAMRVLLRIALFTFIALYGLALIAWPKPPLSKLPPLQSRIVGAIGATFSLLAIWSLVA